MKLNLVVLTAALALFTPPAARAADEISAQAADSGLQLVEKDRRGAIYADPEADWTVYSKIMLDDATVAFRKNWQRDQNRSRMNRVSTSDMERIKSSLAELFDDVFVETLSADGGFEIVTEPGDDVLRLSPHIFDLDVYAPDTRTSAQVYSYTESSGRMTLKLEAYDSVTGDLIAVASDRRESPYRGYVQWTTSVSNQADARRMLQKWAEALRTRLEEATGM